MTNDHDRRPKRGDHILSDEDSPKLHSVAEVSGEVYTSCARGTGEWPVPTFDFERIVPRVLRNVAVFGVVLLAPAFWFYGAAGALGFAFGALVSYLNFRSLARGVEGLADRIVGQESREKGGLIVLRFVLRYGLVGIGAYAIFKGSLGAFYGFLWGLCVPVAALMAEAAMAGHAEMRR